MTAFGRLVFASLLLGAAGCEPFSAPAPVVDQVGVTPVLSSPAPVPIPSDLVTTLRMGAPEGVRPIPPVPGAYTDAELAARSGAIDAVQKANSDLMTLVAEPAEWTSAADAVQRYVESPPPSVAQAPSYLLEQLEVVAILSRPDAFDEPLAPHEVAIAERLLSSLVRNRSGDLEGAARLLTALDGHLSASQAQRYARNVLNGEADYQGRKDVLIEMVRTGCEERCLDDPFVQGLTDDSGSARMSSARARLTAVASSEA